MFLKCGQKDNTHYTFGKTDKQIKESATDEKMNMIICSGCGAYLSMSNSFCSKCGKKI